TSTDGSREATLEILQGSVGGNGELALQLLTPFGKTVVTPSKGGSRFLVSVDPSKQTGVTVLSGGASVVLGVSGGKSIALNAGDTLLATKEGTMTSKLLLPDGSPALV